MSIKLMAWAWETDLPQTEKMVLLCLCDHANDSGDCWPSVTRLAAKCSVTDRTVQKAIQSLRDKGVLTWAEADGRTHRYTIHPRTTFTPEEYSPPKITTQPPNDVHPTPERRSPEPSITIIEPSYESGNKPEPYSPSDDDFTFDDFIETWNEVAREHSLGAIKRKTEPRRRAFNARKREYPDIADWRAAFRCLQSNKWMHGDNKTGWRADPDFFLQAKSFTKLVENQYGQAER
jgi:biotin operon repressor